MAENIATDPGYQENNRNEDGTFKDGVSGNPTGRPKGTYSIMTIIRKRMEEIPLGQTKEWKEQLADVILEEAIVKRNPKIITLIVEHMDGKAKQPIDFDVSKDGVGSLTDLLQKLSDIKHAANNLPSSLPGGSTS